LGSRRQQAQPKARKPTYSDEEVAAAIVVVVAGYYAVPNVEQAVAAILLEAIVPGLPDVASAGAGFAIREASNDGGREAGAAEGQGGVRGDGAPVDGGPEGDERVSSGGGESGTVSGGRFESLIFRAHYVINAARRIAKRVRSGRELGEAILAEEANFRAHLDANRQRLRGSDAQFALAEAYQTTRFKWHHSGKQDYRPSHKAAEGKVYDINEPPASTGALPGVLIHCECWAEPMPPDTAVTLR
jgi:hypothetical protein